LHSLFCRALSSNAIDDLAFELFVQPYGTAERISLRVATTSVRTSGRPQHSIDEVASFRDDFAFLLVKEEDLHAFDRVVLNLNPFYINRRLPGDVNISDPVSFSWFEDVKLTMRTNGLLVCKYGLSTDLSVGRLVDITKCAPQGWYGDLREDMLCTASYDQGCCC
jgi:hypothetical protein